MIIKHGFDLKNSSAVAQAQRQTDAATYLYRIGFVGRRHPFDKRILGEHENMLPKRLPEQAKTLLGSEIIAAWFWRCSTAGRYRI